MTTHDTESHAGRTDNDKTKANLGLIGSAAPVGTSAVPWLGALESMAPFLRRLPGTHLIIGPCIKLLQFGSLFHFCPVFFAFIVNALFAAGTQLSGNAVGALPAASLLWVVGLIVASWLGMLPSQDETLSLTENATTNNSRRPSTNNSRMPRNSTRRAWMGSWECLHPWLPSEACPTPTPT